MCSSTLHETQSLKGDVNGKHTINYTIFDGKDTGRATYSVETKGKKNGKTEFKIVGIAEWGYLHSIHYFFDNPGYRCSFSFKQYPAYTFLYGGALSLISVITIFVGILLGAKSGELQQRANEIWKNKK